MMLLQHRASIKVAVWLHKEFGLPTLVEAFDELQQEKSTTAGEERPEIRRAKESLLRVPTLFRRTIMEAVHGTDREVAFWKVYFKQDFELKEVEGSFYFDPDGSIDPVRTARNLVENGKLDVIKRFKLSCVYCLVESAQALWAEMQESGATEGFGTCSENIVSFWVEWLREQPRVTSAQSFLQSLGTSIHGCFISSDCPQTPAPCLAAIFPHLRSEDRRGCLRLLNRTSMNDLRLCLYTLTSEEEEELLILLDEEPQAHSPNSNLAYRILCIHLMWPFQSLFLEMAETMWDYIHYDTFAKVLSTIFTLKDRRKDFDYANLCESFWKASPLRLRENERMSPHFRKEIVSFLSLQNKGQSK